MKFRAPWLLLVSALLLAAAATWLARGEREVGFRAPLAETGASDPVLAFAAQFQHGERSVSARLAPLHGEAPMQAHEARVLAERFGLQSGEPWRLELTGVDGPAPVHAQVEDAVGVALVPIAELLAASAQDGASQASVRSSAGEVDPLRALVGATGARLEGGARSILLWGRVPVDSAVLVLELDPGTRASQPLAKTEVACGSLPRHLARLESSAKGSPRTSAAEDSER